MQNLSQSQLVKYQWQIQWQKESDGFPHSQICETKHGAFNMLTNISQQTSDLVFIAVTRQFA